ncbi:hypothetical protein HPB49_011557 [Dermacentor silvarum]|uniref:Uncharacterized protein n=1 Tax=Dermacentor silvarum TaxID=543639 RepID=A0ACB8D559_DERSI|nr:geminin isoform X1 [Dermacentor silvarum]XP_049520928.1 geminin isoform X1 [Dermacentor silvarum]XP_049520929.1 geminin isoform X1 [Dermacentor silvarum]KAH7959510.1 hypothetical protein HPB49_011557 [Dermacentor silvarum]
MKATSRGLKRKALSEVQPTAANRKGISVADGLMCLSRLKGQKPADPENSAPPTGGKAPSESCDAYDLMANERVPAQYWKELAEQRRVALDKALKENEQLHEKLELLTAENRHLQTIADQALPLADLLKELGALSSKELERSHQE